MNAAGIRRQLVEIGKKLDSLGLVIGPGGNISARLGDVVYMKASGICMCEAKPSDYVGVDINTGKLVDGVLKPTSETPMHLECYRVRRDVMAVVHTHPTYASAVAMQGKPFKPVNPDFVALLCGEVPLIGFVKPTGQELADAVAAKIRKSQAVMMMNHGLISVGTTLKEALYRTMFVEETAKLVVAAKTLGKMSYLTGSQAKCVDALPAEAYRRKLLKK